jgi:hypothetical protein
MGAWPEGWLAITHNQRLKDSSVSAISVAVGEHKTEKNADVSLDLHVERRDVTL